MVVVVVVVAVAVAYVEGVAGVVIAIVFCSTSSSSVHDRSGSSADESTSGSW